MNSTILLIDDNEATLENVASILELAQYKVLKAANGKIGVELAHKHKPDLVLCEIMMSELDGYGVLYVLSKRAVTMDIPFVFLTSRANPQTYELE